MTRVSVIIPTHNRPHLLPRAVASAFGAGRGVEVIVVDDASRDETAEVCRSLRGIKYVRVEENLGVAGARNIGLASAQSPLIAFLDDDDMRLPGSLDLQVDALEQHTTAGLICGSVLVGDADCRPVGCEFAPPQNCTDLFWEIVGFGYSPLPIAVVVRRECFARVGQFKTELAGIDDWDMWARIAEVFPVLTIGQPVAVYRKPTSESEQGSSNTAAHYRRAARHQKRLMELSRARAETRTVRRRVRRLALHRMSAHLFFCGAQALRCGEYSHAVTDVLSGFRTNPLCLIRPEFFKGVGKHLTSRD